MMPADEQTNKKNRTPYIYRSTTERKQIKSIIK